MSISLTSDLFKLSAPYDNPYQGKAPRGLFVCSAGLLRSATMANYFAKKGWNTRAAGTHNYALVPLSFNLLMWAQHVYFVNRENYEVARKAFEGHSRATAILDDAIVLDITDQYPYNHPDLIRIIEEQTGYA